MLTDIDHIGIAVPDIQSVIDTYRTGFNLEPDHIETVKDQQVKVVIYKIGESTIEYLEPTSDSSPISKFLSKKGQAIHHIAYNVSDLNSAIIELMEKGFDLIDQKPRTGAGGKKIAFINPKRTNGILIELCEVM